MDADFTLAPPPLRRKYLTARKEHTQKRETARPYLGPTSRIWQAHAKLLREDLETANAYIKRQDRALAEKDRHIALLARDNGQLIAQLRAVQNENTRLQREYVPRSCLAVLGGAA